MSKAGASQKCSVKGQTVDMRVPLTMTQLCMNTAMDGTQVND